MRKTLFIYIGLIASLLFSGCESEETLTPSNLDKDRVGEFVSSVDKALVKSVYEKYHCGLMYEYDPTLDFAYTAENDDASTLWGQVSLPMIKEAYLNEEGEMTPDSLIKYNAYVDKALTFIDTTIFKYFGDEGMIVENMPFKILISNSVTSGKTISNRILTESESRIGDEVINVVNCVYNNHSIAFNIKEDGLLFNAEKYRKDNFYIFLCRIMEMHNLYDYLPEEFSLLSSVYYNRSIEEVYAEDFGIDLDDDSEDAETVPEVIDKQWFYSKGFIDAKYFYNRDGSGLTTIDGEIKAIKKTYSFVETLEMDVRSFLNEMLHRTPEELSALPDITKNKMKILLTNMEEWGVDLVAFNPALEVIQ